MTALSEAADVQSIKVLNRENGWDARSLIGANANNNDKVKEENSENNMQADSIRLSKNFRKN